MASLEGLIYSMDGLIRGVDILYGWPHLRGRYIVWMASLEGMTYCMDGLMTRVLRILFGWPHDEGTENIVWMA